MADSEPNETETAPQITPEAQKEIDEAAKLENATKWQTYGRKRKPKDD